MTLVASSDPVDDEEGEGERVRERGKERERKIGRIQLLYGEREKGNQKMNK
jgi:hypothetical protein